MNDNNRNSIEVLPTWKAELLELDKKDHGMIEKIYYDRREDGSGTCVVLLLAIENLHDELCQELVESFLNKTLK